MALTEQQIVDLVELIKSKSDQVFNVNIIESDSGVELKITFHKHVSSPGDSIINEYSRIQSITNAIWTEEVTAAYQVLIASAKN
jgi:hypothetical protein